MWSPFRGGHRTRADGKPRRHLRHRLTRRLASSGDCVCTWGRACQVHRRAQETAPTPQERSRPRARWVQGSTHGSWRGAHGERRRRRTALRPRLAAVDQRHVHPHTQGGARGAGRGPRSRARRGASAWASLRLLLSSANRRVEHGFPGRAPAGDAGRLQPRCPPTSLVERPGLPLMRVRDHGRLRSRSGPRPPAFRVGLTKGSRREAASLLPLWGILDAALRLCLAPGRCSQNRREAWRPGVCPGLAGSLGATQRGCYAAGSQRTPACSTRR